MEPHEGALVITAQVGAVDMRRIMMDNGFSVDILYNHAYQRMDLEGRKMEVGQKAHLYRFSNDTVNVVGTIKRPITFGIAPQYVQVNVKFFVVQVDSTYNAILGRTTLAVLHAVTFIPQFKIKFSTPNGVDEVKRDWDIAQRCYRNTLISSGIGVSKQRQTMKVEVEPFAERAIEPLALPAEETEDVELILGNSIKTIKIGSRLGEPF